MPLEDVLDEPLLTDVQAAKAMGVTPETMAVWRCRGDGPEFVKLGRAVRYTRSAIRKFVASRTKAPKSTAERRRDRAERAGV
jgi:predicted DNA-binding transcriptional regulator AlpA